MESQLKERIGTMQKEEIPEGYKKTEAGIIPAEWKVEKLSSLFPKIRNGFVGTATPFYVDNGVKYLQGNNIKKGRIISDGLIYVSEEFHAKQKKSKLSLGDIIMVQSGHVGECAVINEEYEDSNCHALIVMTPTKKVDSYYYSYLFNSNYGEKLFYKIKTGNTVEHILASDMNKLKVPVPDFSEQQKIAEILLTWDKAIELKEKLIEQKKKQKKGLIQLLYTGIIRAHEVGKRNREEIKKRIQFVFNGRVPDGYKATKLGIIPTEWRVIHLKDKFERLTRKNNSNNTNVLTISAQQGLISQEEFFNKSVASENLSNYYLLQKGDFAYNKSYSKGFPYGAIKVLEQYESGVVSPLYICFSPNKTNKCPEFYKYYFEFGFLNREIHAIAQEGARNHGLLNISVNDFFNTYIVDMDENEMKQITEIVLTATKEIKLLEQELESLKQQKKGLMQLLLTGKVRVKC
jgi:type I restriction enzyme, S subunit